MARGAWHGLRGPADFFIPDDTRELVYSGAGSAFTTAAAYVLNSREVTRTISRMAAHHVVNVYAANPGAVYPRAALRKVAQRQVIRGSVLRGLGMMARLTPGISMVAWALTIAASIPPTSGAALALRGQQQRYVDAYIQALHDL